MKLITQQIAEHIKDSSWIRRMFEVGLEMKKRFGAENVFDFSLGNPDVPTPAKAADVLREMADHANDPLYFGYVSNAGLQDVRQALATHLTDQQKSPITADDIVLTCGAAGAMNVIFHSILEDKEEVVCPAPYFAEYRFYVENHSGKLIPVKCKPFTFELDLPTIKNAITPATRAVLLNSPNNPSGRVYPTEQLQELANLLRKLSEGRDRPIFLILDEPYRFLAYDGLEPPAVMPFYDFSMSVASFSKSHSLAGERIGYVAVNPGMPNKSELLHGMITVNRTLGFVNAPIIGQYLLKNILDTGVNVDIYAERRKAMADILRNAGIDFATPDGAFYFFPKVPGNITDETWIDILKEEKILAVPGLGFGYPGYFRMSFCVNKETILNAEPALKRAADKARSL
ncbi:MAG: pyridoxal phosphate-dependent aminotransferase [Lentisphaerae bacterium]|nr:pyridoxal phosphate-dependent aminotransferase [Lentisphaerota bacterium]